MEKITSAIIVAGGSGKRMNSEVPKQFLELAGKPIIIHTVEKFQQNRNIDAIVVVCVESCVNRLKELLNEYKVQKVHAIVSGGKTRQESSYKGLQACPEGTEYVLIHDAVRPFVGNKIIEDVLAAAIKNGAAGCCVDLIDTIVETKEDFIVNIPKRKSFKRIQTPQGFKYDLIRKAHDEAVKNKKNDITDDCGIVVDYGASVMIVKGEDINFKITNLSDIIYARDLSVRKDKDKEAL